MEVLAAVRVVVVRVAAVWAAAKVAAAEVATAVATAVMGATAAVTAEWAVREGPGVARAGVAREEGRAVAMAKAEVGMGWGGMAGQAGPTVEGKVEEGAAPRICLPVQRQ